MRKLVGALEVVAVATVIALLLSGQNAPARGRSAPPPTTSTSATGLRGQTGTRPDRKKTDHASKADRTRKANQSESATSSSKQDSSTKKSTASAGSIATTNPSKPRPVTPSAQRPIYQGYRYASGPNRSGRVALTFDDCPRNLTVFKAVVIGAEKLGVGLILFPTGDCLRSGRFSASFARAHGHYVFNHSISHPDLDRQTYAGVLAQLGRPGIQSRYGRPPFGDINATVAHAYAAKGMKIWTWTVDTLDWRGRSQQNVIRAAVHGPGAGGTVLMHMQWHGFSVSAIRQMKAGLDQRGLGTCRNFPGTTPSRSWTVRC